MSMADFDYLLSGKRNSQCSVVDQNKVISTSMGFVKLDFHGSKISFLVAKHEKVQLLNGDYIIHTPVLQKHNNSNSVNEITYFNSIQTTNSIND